MRKLEYSFSTSEKWKKGVRLKENTGVLAAKLTGANTQANGYVCYKLALVDINIYEEIF